MPRQVPRLAPRREQKPGRWFAFRKTNGLGVVPFDEPVFQRRNRRRGKGNVPLAPTFPADQDQARRPAHGGHGQGYEFAHSHAGRIEHLHQADIARPFARAARGGNSI